MTAEALFRQRMVALRKSRSMSQSALAAAFDRYGLPFHQQLIARIETGKRAVRLDEAVVIADIFGTSVAAMAGLSGESADLDRRARAAELAARIAEDATRIALTLQGGS